MTIAQDRNRWRALVGGLYSETGWERLIMMKWPLLCQCVSLY